MTWKLLIVGGKKIHLPPLLLLPQITFKGSVSKEIQPGEQFWSDSVLFNIPDGLGSHIGVWNIGSGWARAYDAASDGGWLFKAKQSKEIPKYMSGEYDPHPNGLAGTAVAEAFLKWY